MEAKEGRKSLSNVIKKEQHPLFEIESFNAEEMEKDYGTFPPSSKNGRVELLIGDGPHRKSQRTPKGQEKQSESSGESLQDKLARLEREAYEKGFEQGQRDGLVLGERRVEETLKQMQALLCELARLKEQVYLEAEKDLVKLSIGIAEKILRRELREDLEAVTRSIRSAIGFLASRSSVKIFVSPEDLAEATKLLPDLATSNKLEKYDLVGDETIEKGGCVVETGFGKIDATITEGLAVLERELEREIQVRTGKGDGR